MSKELDRQLLVEAMERLGKTADGRMLYMHLQTVLLAVDALPGNVDTSGALRENYGRRLLAREIRNLMAPGVRETDPRIDERPTVINPPEPVRLATAANRGARRRISELPAGNPAGDTAD